jgi:FkbM family methyltransferase
MTEMVEVVINGEFKIVLPQHRADRPEWYEPEGWEKIRTKSMSNNIGKGDIVYYVGAEEGEFPALCQMWGARVVLFEPNPQVWSHYPILWSANKLEPPIATVAAFASDINNDKTEIFRNGFPPVSNEDLDKAHGFKELYLEGDSYGQITIDSLVYDHKLEAPTAISIDVEGSEWKVLKGAEAVLREHRPKIWLSGHPEFMFHQFGEYLSEVRHWIKELGYKEILLDYQHEVHLFYE